MKNRYRYLNERLAILSERERLLLLLVLFAAVLFFWLLLLQGPLLTRLHAVGMEHGLLREELRLLQQEQQVLTTAPNSAAGGELTQTHETLQQNLKAINQRLDLLSTDLISPSQLMSVIKTLLAHDNELNLVSLRMADPVLLTNPKSGVFHDDDEPAALDLKNKLHKFQTIAALNKLASYFPEKLYSHPMELTLRGNYLALVNFLQTIEKSSWRVFWDGLSYNVENYPNAVIVLRFHTLSKENGVGHE